MAVGTMRVLLADEISTGLDSNTTFQITKALRNLSARAAGVWCCTPPVLASLETGWGVWRCCCCARPPHVAHAAPLLAPAQPT